MMVAEANNSGRALSDLLHGLAAVEPSAERDIAGLALDSKHVRRGDLFLACQGARVHGIAYATQAIARGAAAVAYETGPHVDADALVLALEPLQDARVPVIAVERLAQQVGAVADRFFGHPTRDLFVTGVTGTNGKTSCSQFIAQALTALERGAKPARCGCFASCQWWP